jgi:hypothetical protein
MPIPSGYKSVFNGNVFNTLRIHNKDYIPKIILLKDGRQISYNKTEYIDNDKVTVYDEEIYLKDIKDIYKKSDGGPFTIGGRKSSKRRSFRRSKKQRKSRKYKK